MIYNHRHARMPSVLAAILGAMLLLILSGCETAENKAGFDFDVIFLLDNSGSMRTSDEYGLALSAAGLFADLCRSHDTNAGYILYTDASNPISFPFINISGKDGADFIKANIYATKDTRRGYTDIGWALTQAADMMDARPEDSDTGRKPIIILLSDGNVELRDSDIQAGRSVEMSEQEARDTAAALALRGVSVHTISFDYYNNLDPTLLIDIAEATGGTFTEIKEASGLLTAMSEIYAYEVKKPHVNIDGGLIFETINPEVSGNHYIARIPIPNDSLFEANIIIHTGSRLVTGITLLNHQGQEIAVSERNGIIYASGKDYVMLKLAQPIPSGELTLEFTLDELAAVESIVQVRSLIAYNFELGLDASSDTVQQGETLTFSAYLKDMVQADRKITDSNLFQQADMRLHLTYPSGREWTSDNFDGILSFKFGGLEPGEYRVSLAMELSGSYKESRSIPFTLTAAPATVLEPIDVPFIPAEGFLFFGNEKRFNLSDYASFTEGSVISRDIEVQGEEVSVRWDEAAQQIVVKALKSGHHETIITLRNQWGAAAQIPLTINALPAELSYAAAALICLSVLITAVISALAARPKLTGQIFICLENLPAGAGEYLEAVSLIFPKNVRKISLRKLLEYNAAVKEDYNGALSQISSFSKQFIFRAAKGKGKRKKNPVILMSVPEGSYNKSYRLDRSFTDMPYSPDSKLVVKLSGPDGAAENYYEIAFGKESLSEYALI